MDTTIKVENLTKKFGQVIAVDNVSFEVQKGNIFGFLGPNGSGKSTVIRMLCGILTPTSGKANLLGHDVTQDPEAVKNRIGYMSQKVSLYEELTVEENMYFYGQLYGIKGQDLKKRQEELFALTHIESYLKRRVEQLSGGWKQRLALACAMIHKPEIVFLDEPTAGIDRLRAESYGICYLNYPLKELHYLLPRIIWTRRNGAATSGTSICQN